MEMNFYIERERYPWASLFADLLAGFAAVIVIVVGSLALGGFSFWLPWLVLSPVVLFLTGFVRASSFGNSWAKALVIDIPVFMLMVASLRATTPLGSAATILIAILIAVLLTAGGVAFRRRSYPSGD